MKKKWSVKKQDGVWKVFDKAQRLRYSCDNHFMALSFALMRGEKKTTPFHPRLAMGESWTEILKQVWGRSEEGDDDE